MLHVVPDENKVDYARSLVSSIGTVLSLDNFSDLSDHDLNMMITALELTYNIAKGVMGIRTPLQEGR